MKVFRIFLMGLITGFLLLSGAWSSDVRIPSQPVVVNSHSSFPDTVRKLKSAIKARNLSVIFEASHGEIMARTGVVGKDGITIGFTGPKIRHEVLRAEPRAALEIPFRIVVRELDSGRVDVIYFQPSYLFAHYGSRALDKLSRMMDILVGSIIKEATESNG